MILNFPQALIVNPRRSLKSLACAGTVKLLASGVSPPDGNISTENFAWSW